MTSKNKTPILGRMKQTLDIYRMVKLVDETAHKMERATTVSPDAYSLARPAVVDINREFKKKYKLTSERRLRIILGLAINRKCLEVVKGEFEGYSINVIEIKDDGWKLLDKPPYLPFVPWGLWRAWLEMDGKLAVIVVSVATGAIIRELVTWGVHHARW